MFIPVELIESDSNPRNMVIFIKVPVWARSEEDEAGGGESEG